MTSFRHSPWRNLIYGLIYLLAVIALASFAYVLVGWSWGDAFYFVTITVFTVGYEELHPLEGWLRPITEVTIVLGWIGITFLAAALVQFITFAQIQQLLGIKRMQTQIDKMTGHVIICGFGRIGQLLAGELQAGGTEFAIVELDEDRFADAVSRGYATVKGDATDEAILAAVGVNRARALASVVPNDAANVFITLTARNMNKQLEIISRGEAPSTKNKLLQAGANSVVQPTHIGAERIAQLILFPRSQSMTETSDRMRTLGVGLRTLGLELEIMPVAAESPLAGATVAHIETEGGGGIFVVAINRRNGETISRPEPSTIVEAGDGVVIITRAGRSTPHIS